MRAAAIVAVLLFAPAPALAEVHFGLFAGGALGVVGADVESDHFWIALSSPIALTLASAALPHPSNSGTQGSPDIDYVIHLAGGPRFRLGASSWYVTPFVDAAMFSVARYDDNGGNYDRSVVSGTMLGVGCGFHAAWRNGLILQVNVPLIGLTLPVNNDSLLIWFYWGAVTMPIAVVGYRF